jgi:hypothetical protein
VNKFDEVFQRVSKTPNVQGFSVELRALLRALYRELERRPPDLAGLRGSLMDLLEFLSSPEGRTDANCWMADLFVMHLVFFEPAPFEDVADDVPIEYADLLGEMMGLHDTVSAPEIAKMARDTPEDLLEQARALEV